MAPSLNWGARPNLWVWSRHVLSLLCGVFLLRSFPWGPRRLLLSWNLGLCSCYPHFHIPHCYRPLFNSLTLCTSPPSSIHDTFSLYPSHSSLPLMFIPSSIFPLLNRTEAATLLSSFLLSFKWSVSCIVGIPHTVPNLHSSVSMYHVCSFGTELLHSG